MILVTLHDTNDREVLVNPMHVRYAASVPNGERLRSEYSTLLLGEEHYLDVIETIAEVRVAIESAEAASLLMAADHIRREISKLDDVLPPTARN